MNNTWMTTAALGAVIALSACNSSGSTRRFASVGTQAVTPTPKPIGSVEEVPETPSGNSGDSSNPVGNGNGSNGSNGSDGSQGTNGTNGQDGGQFTLGQVGMIATGGLVGPDGMAGTGLFANLGDPSTSIPVISDAAAGAGIGMASIENGLSSAMNSIDQTGELSPVTSPLMQTVSGVSSALTSFGSDGAPLVDGVTSSASPLLTANVGGSTAVGGTGTSALGVSVLSADQASGSIAEVGVASNDTLLNVDLATSSDTGLSVAGLADVDLGPVTAGLNDLNGTSDLTETLDETLTDTVGGLLSGDEGGNSPAAPVGSKVKGLLGGLGLH